MIRFQSKITQNIEMKSVNFVADAATVFTRIPYIFLEF